MSDTKTDAVNVMERVAELRRRGKEIDERVLTEQLRLAMDTKTLREVIRTGIATTGDRITDYMIVAYGDLDPASERAKSFRDIEKQLAGKTGELFFVVQRENVRHGVATNGPSDFYLRTQYDVGILSADTLVFDLKEQKHGLPTEWYTEMSSDWRMYKHPGPFQLSTHGLHDLGMVIHDGDKAKPALEVLIGDAAVFGCVSARSLPWGVPIFDKMFQLFGKEVPEAPEEKQIAP